MGRDSLDVFSLTCTPPPKISGVLLKWVSSLWLLTSQCTWCLIWERRWGWGEERTDPFINPSLAKSERSSPTLEKLIQSGP